MDPRMKHAMSAVMAGMGKAAKDAKAKRFQKKPVEMTMESVSMHPKPEMESPEMGHGMSDDEMAEMLKHC